MLSSDCGCPLRVKVHLARDKVHWTHASKYQPQAYQLRLMLASLTISSAPVIFQYPPPIQKVVQMQAIGANTVDLSLNALNAMSGMNRRVLGLVEVPEDLQLLKTTVCELYMHCFALVIVPEWLGELVHLRVLHLDGEWSEVISNRALIELPETLGTLHCLQSLTLKNLESLRTLPFLMVTLTSLETLHIENCWGFEVLPPMGVMPTLRSLTLCDSMLTLLACLGEFNLHYLSKSM